MNLVIDIGNTKIKAGVFRENDQVDTKIFHNTQDLTLFIAAFKGNIIISSVGKKSDVTELKDKFNHLLVLDHLTPLPIQIAYDTPKTLGLDRVAAAVAAYQKKNEACLVVDIGTCITLDVIDAKGVFIGGNISPGPEIRFKAMHNFTASLPLETLEQESTPIGKSTKEALQSGVKYGILGEILHMHSELKTQYPEIKLVLTGGYATFFDSMLKEGIFAEPNLVLEGLNTILIYNVKK